MGMKQQVEKPEGKKSGNVRRRIWAVVTDFSFVWEKWDLVQESTFCFCFVCISLLVIKSKSKRKEQRIRSIAFVPRAAEERARCAALARLLSRLKVIRLNLSPQFS